MRAARAAMPVLAVAALAVAPGAAAGDVAFGTRVDPAPIVYPLNDTFTVRLTMRAGDAGEHFGVDAQAPTWAGDGIDSRAPSGAPIEPVGPLTLEGPGTIAERSLDAQYEDRIGCVRGADPQRRGAIVDLPAGTRSALVSRWRFTAPPLSFEEIRPTFSTDPYLPGSTLSPEYRIRPARVDHVGASGVQIQLFTAPRSRPLPNPIATVRTGRTVRLYATTRPNVPGRRLVFRYRRSAPIGRPHEDPAWGGPWRTLASVRANRTGNAFASFRPRRGLWVIDAAYPRQPGRIVPDASCPRAFVAR